MRFYTLNYDRLFKILALKSGLTEVFEGFDCDNPNGEFYYIKPNVHRIINNVNTHCHYNLHGSIFWTVVTRDVQQLVNPEIYYKGSPDFQLNIYEQPSIQIEKGKNILLSNIITGYQKTQKSIITPLKQMQACFDNDCLNSDCLYIIECSFGDELINMSIKTAIAYNSKLKIVLVDPSYYEGKEFNGYKLLQERFIHIFSPYLENQFECQKVDEQSYLYFKRETRSTYYDYESIFKNSCYKIRE